MIKKGDYQDNLSRLKYNLSDDLLLEKNEIFQIVGDNGVGKSRFIEGVLLKELKKMNKKILYFGQDIENQILSFNLISLVNKFTEGLKKQGSFFKTIFLNDDSHESIQLDFNEEETLYPNDLSKKEFIFNQCKKYTDLDVIIFDEVDKYFDSNIQFVNFLKSIKNVNIFMISHILSKNEPGLEMLKTISLVNNDQGVNIEFLNF